MVKTREAIAHGSRCGSACVDPPKVNHRLTEDVFGSISITDPL
jgi:hypothetical protein